LNSYKQVIVIFVIIKPLHPKLSHAFGYGLSQVQACILKHDQW